MNDILTTATKVLEQNGFTVFFGFVVTTVFAVLLWRLGNCAMKFAGRAGALYLKTSLRTQRSMASSVEQVSRAQSEMLPLLRLIPEGFHDLKAEMQRLTGRENPPG